MKRGGLQLTLMGLNDVTNAEGIDIVAVPSRKL